MERNLFIANLYIKFIFKYLVISFFCMYAVGYFIVIAKSSIYEKAIFNPLTTKLEKVYQTNENTEYYLTYYDTNNIIQNHLFKNNNMKKLMTFYQNIKKVKY